MNPFDWPGPAFLLFYAALAIVVHFVVRALYRRGPDDITALAQARSLLDDPYRLACLRAGPSEAICVALFSLLDRGLLRYDGSTVRARDDAAIGFSRRPIEQAVLKATAKPREPKELIEADGPVAAAKSYEAELTRNGLIADARVRVDRRGALYVALGVLLGVAVLKILVALIRG